MIDLTSPDIEYILTLEECIRKQNGLYMKYVLKEIDSDIVVLEINGEYPISAEELKSHIRSFIRDKKIDALLND